MPISQERLFAILAAGEAFKESHDSCLRAITSAISQVQSGAIAPAQALSLIQAEVALKDPPRALGEVLVAEITHFRLVGHKNRKRAAELRAKRASEGRAPSPSSSPGLPGLAPWQTAQVQFHAQRTSPWGKPEGQATAQGRALKGSFDPELISRLEDMILEEPRAKPQPSPNTISPEELSSQFSPESELDL